MRAWSLPTAVTERSPSPVGRFAIRSVTVAARVTGGASYVGKQLDRSAFAQLGDPLKVGAGCSPVEVGQPGDSAVPAQELAEAGVPETVGCGAELVEQVGLHVVGRYRRGATLPCRGTSAPRVGVSGAGSGEAHTMSGVGATVHPYMPEPTWRFSTYDPPVSAPPQRNGSLRWQRSSSLPP